MPNTPYKVQDVRAFDARAVQIAQQLDSNEPADYRRIEKWLNAGAYAHYSIDTLTELFDRDVGLAGEASKHPDRPRSAG